MLGWLSLIVAALAGLFVLFQSNAGVLDGVPALPIAAGVLAVLVALYLMTMRGSRREATGINRILPLLALAIAIGAAILAAKHKPIASSVIDAFDKLRGNAGGRDGASTSSGSGPVSVMIRRSDDGRFVAQGDINGTSTTFLIDTGASVVMLKPSDAERAGIDIKALSFTTPVQTANGTVYAAPVRVRSLSIGLLHLGDIEALVAQPGSLNENLLGMSFLRRLSSYKLSGDFMTLRE